MCQLGIELRQIWIEFSEFFSSLSDFSLFCYFYKSFILHKYVFVYILTKSSALSLYYINCKTVSWMIIISFIGSWLEICDEADITM